jgi:FkbM family methyltransferase
MISGDYKVSFKCKLGWLIARPGLQRFWELWSSMGALGMGYGNYAYNWNGEARIIREWNQTADNASVIFDVGANEGDLTALFKRGTVFAFEPHPRTFQRLSARFKERRSVRPVNLGLGARRCRLTLYDMPGEGSDQATLIAGADRRLIKGINVDVDTLDGWCQRNNIDKIDFLKMDVEGFEPEVLMGASLMLKKRRIGLILFEMNHHSARTGFNVLKAIESLPNHRLYRLLPNGLFDIEGGRGYRPAFDSYRLHNLLAIPRAT